MDYADYPPFVAEDIIRLRRRIDNSQLPSKLSDYNLIIGTWNLRNFGRVYSSWGENPSSPKRNLYALAVIAEIIRCYDILAIQEVKSDTSGIRMLQQEFLGSDWGLLMSDVSGGPKGNDERLAFIYDKRRAQPTGLAGEIVLPSTNTGDPVQQFDRTPYIVGFQSAGEKVSLLTAHIRYGNVPEDRLPELRSLAKYVATEIRDRTKMKGEETNLIVLGDFNIDERGDNPLFQEFVSTGLVVPPQLLNLKTTYATKPKYYDHIAWFMGELDVRASEKAGVVDFVGSVFKNLTGSQMSFRVSDHFPLWVEFLVDRSEEAMARTLGIDIAMDDPFGSILD